MTLIDISNTRNLETRHISAYLRRGGNQKERASPKVQEKSNRHGKETTDWVLDLEQDRVRAGLI